MAAWLWLAACLAGLAMVSPSPVRVLALLVVMATRRVCTATATQEAALLQHPRQQFSVDLGGPPSPQPFDSAAVTRCFGSSHAATAMRADWQRELALPVGTHSGGSVGGAEAARDGGAVEGLRAGRPAKIDAELLAGMLEERGLLGGGGGADSPRGHHHQQCQYPHR